ncbi:DUF2304 family protein [Candidatus Woesearchaeota archaeon]|nr:DUF2304 family protein [Candidatus Woesearchaeota archaeon]
MIRISHFIAIIYSIIMLILTYRLYRKNKLNFLGLGIWTSIWLALFAGILLFDRIETVANILLGMRVMDVFVFGAILIIFILLFLLNFNIVENKRKVQEIIEETALREGTKKK